MNTGVKQSRVLSLNPPRTNQMREIHANTRNNRTVPQAARNNNPEPTRNNNNPEPARPNNERPPPSPIRHPPSLITHPSLARDIPQQSASGNRAGERAPQRPSQSAKSGSRDMSHQARPEHTGEREVPLGVLQEHKQAIQPQPSGSYMSKSRATRIRVHMNNPPCNQAPQ